METRYRSRAFSKIKNTILSSSTQSNMNLCRNMIENSASILSNDEKIILIEYYDEKLKGIMDPIIKQEEDLCFKMAKKYYSKNKSSAEAFEKLCDNTNLDNLKHDKIEEILLDAIEDYQFSISGAENI